MAFYAGQIIKHPGMENPTLVVLTDRNDLDDQLFGTFSMCKDLLRQTPIQAEDRDDLRRLLDRAFGGVIFTTIQKFSPDDGATDYPVLTDRRNVVVIADEAHRSQYGFKAKDRAEDRRDLLWLRQISARRSAERLLHRLHRNADREGRREHAAVFGEYIDVYDISRAVEDGATVPIYYESRLARIELADDEKPKIDAEIEELTEDEAADRTRADQTQMGDRRGARRLREAPCDGRGRSGAAFRGSRRRHGRQGDGRLHEPPHLCRALQCNLKLRPDWHSDDDEAGAIKVVMTGSAVRSAGWQPHIGTTKARRDLLAKRAKDPKIRSSS